ncbi:hypothetical protein [Peribacillus frigoritolerans]|uniref:hypothetical protein n=1 Tax=Peribacillus frigoritolerans TaxID=450367 RepID=UPI0020C11E09|nr:hypothetical protein [Peribacillus frigoritolerans]MEE3951645.1 hypothetical protein [Peribacillus frigoritolerans]
MLIEGETTCKDCKHDFMWYYLYQDEANKVYKKPNFSNKECATLVSANKDKTPKELKVYCHKQDCGYPNFFDVDYTKVKITKQ